MSDNIKSIYGLTPMQEGILFHKLADENAASYHNQHAFWLDGEIDLKLFKLALTLISFKHEALCAAFVIPKSTGIPRQIILENREIECEYIACETEDIEELIQTVKEKDLVRGFDLKKDTLLRLKTIYFTKTKKHLILFSHHHIIMDGWCISLVFGDLMRYYSMLVEGMSLSEVEQLVAEEKKYSSKYGEYLKWLGRQDREAGLNYWKELLSDYDCVAEIIPTIKPQSSECQVKQVQSSFSREETEIIVQMAKRCNVTINTVAEAVWGIVLQKYNYTDDVVFGKVVSGRNVPISGIEETVGLFINTIPCRVRCSTDMSINELLKELKQQGIDGNDFDYCSLAEIQSLTNQKSDLTKTLFVFENYEYAKEQNEVLQIQMESSREQTNYDINVIFYIINDSLCIDLLYNPNRYTEVDVDNLLARIKTVLKFLSNNADAKVCEIETITETERAKILGVFNDTTTEYPREKTVAELFEEQVEKAPEHVAVVCRGEEITYSCLNEKANQVARRLRKLGVGKEDFIAILAERSIGMVIGLCGIMKSGAAYVPIDMSYPEERIRFMLEECSPKAVITAGMEFNLEIGVPVIRLTDEELLEEDNANIGVYTGPKGLAYCIYTSGTSGKPKGSLIENRSIIRLVKNTNYIEIHEENIIMQTGSLSFDASTFEIWGALLNGAKLVIADNDVITSERKLKECLRDNKVDIMFMATALYNQMVQEDITIFDRLKYLMIGGEKLSEEHVAPLRKHNKKLKILNVYGPTENTTYTTIYEIPQDFIRILIGKPIANTQVYVMNGMKLCGIGILGELCISGDGVSRGYLNRPDLTVEKFVENPYGEGKLYHSGDLVRWLPDGSIEFMGRIDEQVKIRGFRIELGEIENIIKRTEYVKNCAVIVKTDSTGDKAICAYIVSDKKISVSAIREMLSKIIPEYMIPAHIIQIATLPLTRNGKVDRKALPEIEAKSEKKYIGPRNENEEILCHIFSDILMIEKVGIKDSFFELGGHSLRATRLINQIEAKMGYRVALKDVFTNPTVEKLAALITGEELKEYIPLPNAEEKEYYPMSSTQKRTYLICQMDREGIAYNMPQSIRLTGEVHPEIIEAALQGMIERHEILRTEFLMIDGEPVQKIRTTVKADFVYEEDEKTDEGLLIQDFVRPFELEKAPMIRVKLVKKSDFWLLMMDMHHIVGDGMSMITFVAEFMSLYNGESLEPLTHQYKDYSEWMRTKDLSEQRKYWVNEFSDDIPVLDMPLDYRRPQKQSYKGAVVGTVTGKKLGTRVKELARSSNTTDYMVFLSAAMVLLSKYSRQNDIVIGSPISGRMHIDTESMLGMFVNTLAMRGYPEGQKSYQTFLAEVKESCLKAFENQEYPFEELVEAVKVRRDISRNPLFDVMLVLQNNEKLSSKLDGTEIFYSEEKGTVSKFDLTYNIFEDNGDFKIELEYCTELFKTETAKRLLTHYICILKQIVDNYDITLNEIEVITVEEREQILGMFNDTTTEYPRDKTVVDLFEEQVEKTPNNIAVVFEDEQITYSELNERVNALAHKLRKMGVKPDDFVAIIAQRSIEMIVGIYGILKAGGAYVPIDKTSPEERIMFMLEDCKPKVVLVYKEEVKTKIPVIDLADSMVWKETTKNPKKVCTPDNLIYCIYTSGTTGRPKGVMNRHKGLLNLVTWMQKLYPLNENDTILQKTTYVFDVSASEILWWSTIGARIVMLKPEAEKDPLSILETIEKHQISMIDFVPSMLAAFMMTIENRSELIQKIKSLKYVIAAGEALNSELVNKFYDVAESEGLQAKIANIYGPTEASIYSAYYNCKAGITMVPIGKPVGNMKLYNLDGNKLCGIGVPGELCIAGVGLAKGYLNRPELTAEKFIDNPFSEGKLYRSGDLARWLPDGNIELLGRIDEQVKIRGFRIELGEIESVIRKEDYVRDCAVIVREDALHNKAIHAYIVSDREISMTEIRNTLGLMLPDYMIPAYIKQIEAIPITMNGKLNKKALPEIEAKSEKEYVAPESETEEILCDIFSKILGVEKVGVKDNFFEMGGDSLKAIRIISKVREYGYSISIQSIMQYQTVSSISRMATLIENYSPSEVISGEVELGIIQKMFLQSELYNPNYFNMAVMLKSKERISEDAMRQALNAVVQHHDMLRVVVKSGKQIIRTVDETKLFTLNTVDLRSISDDAALEAEIKQYVQEAQQSIRLDSGPLVIVTIFKVGDSDHMHICIHHFAIDGVSLRIVIEDILASYYFCKNGESIRLPDKTASFKEWVSVLSEFKDDSAVQREMEYWNSINEQIVELELPLNKNKNDMGTDQFSERLNATDTRGLLTLANRVLHTNISNLLMTAVAKVIYRSYGVKKVALNIESHGRYDMIDRISVDRTVGWFTSIYPLIFEAGNSFNETLDSLLLALQTVHSNGMSYMLTMDNKEIKDIHIPQISFNYLGEIDVNTDASDVISFSEYASGHNADEKNILFGPLAINTSIENGELIIDYIYDKSIWLESEINKLSKDIINLLLEVISGTDENLEIVYEARQNNLIDNLLQQADKELVRFEYETITNATFKDCPLTGIQQFSYVMGVRNVVMHIPFHDRIDVKKLSYSWTSLQGIYDLLKSSISMNTEEKFIRIYNGFQVDIPFIDISGVDNSHKKTLINKLMQKMDCYGHDDVYTVDHLSSKILLVKFSEATFTLLISCSHLICDRFSAEIMKERLTDIYYGNDVGQDKNPYQNYVNLLRNENVTVSENEIIEALGIQEFCQSFNCFVENNKNRKLESCIYKYRNNEKWSLMTDVALLEISQKVFIKAMQYIYLDMDIPIFALHISRKNNVINLFNYVGEFLELAPFVIPKRYEGIIDTLLQDKLSFVQSNNIYFSSLFSHQGIKEYPEIKRMFKNNFETMEQMLIYNNTGILKNSNNLLDETVQSKYSSNIIDISITEDGLQMSLSVETGMFAEMEAFLNSFIDSIIECYM